MMVLLMFVSSFLLFELLVCVRILWLSSFSFLDSMDVLGKLISLNMFFICVNCLIVVFRWLLLLGFFINCFRLDFVIESDLFSCFLIRFNEVEFLIVNMLILYFFLIG